jgi:hypothetical protein
VDLVTRVSRVSRSWLLVWPWALVLNAASAQTPALATLRTGDAPIARVVQRMHNSELDQIRADPSGRLLATIAADKTLRIWRLDDLRPVRSIAVPANTQLEGDLRGLAWAADGRTAFVAGITGTGEPGGVRVYRIDVATGRIIDTISGFGAHVITRLETSLDGKILAVGTQQGGIHWVDLASKRRVGHDPHFKGEVRFIHQSRTGLWAVSSNDGWWRIYSNDAQFILARNPYPADRQSNAAAVVQQGGIRFSPDGRWLALGTIDRREGGRWKPEVALIDAQTWKIARVITVNNPLQRNLCCIAWSADSQILYINGSMAGDGRAPTPLYRIKDPLRGQPEPLAVGEQNLTNMLPLPDGSLIFATTVPSLVKINPEGEPATDARGSAIRADAENLDFYRSRREPQRFRVSADGAQVAFEHDAGSWVTLDIGADLAENAVLTRSTPPNDSLLAATRQGRLAVDLPPTVDGAGTQRPFTVNGTAVALQQGEQPISFSQDDTRGRVALGTQWRLHVLGPDGKPVAGWSEALYLGSSIYHAVLTRDGRYVVVALGDGTVRWINTADATEALAVFVRKDRREWVAWLPDGRYRSSARGDRYFGWLINRGADRSPVLHRAVQFEGRLYDPAAVARALLPNKSQAESAEAARRLTTALTADAAPQVTVTNISAGPRPGELLIDVQAEAGATTLTHINVFADGIPLLTSAAQRIPLSQSSSLTQTFIVQASRQSTIRVEVEAGSQLGFDETAPLVDAATAPGAAPKGRLWVLAIAAQDFPLTKRTRRPFESLPATEKDINLLLAAVNARSVRNAFAGQPNIITVSGAAATRRGVMDAIRRLQGMAPEDTLLLFISSHGYTPKARPNEYYLLVNDSKGSEIESLDEAAEDDKPVPATPSLISGTELYQELRRLPGRRILFLDTCHAGATARSSNPFSMVKRSASAEVATLSAASQDQEAFVDPDNKESFFIAAFAETLKSGPNAKSPAGALTLLAAYQRAEELFRTRLEKYRTNLPPADAKRVRQTPVFSAVPALQETVMAVH